MRELLRQDVGRCDAAETGVGEYIAVYVTQHEVLTELVRVADLQDASILYGDHRRFGRAQQFDQLQLLGFGVGRGGGCRRGARAPQRSLGCSGRWFWRPGRRAAAGRRGLAWSCVVLAVALEADCAAGNGFHATRLPVTGKRPSIRPVSVAITPLG